MVKNAKFFYNYIFLVVIFSGFLLGFLSACYSTSTLQKPQSYSVDKSDSAIYSPESLIKTSLQPKTSAQPLRKGQTTIIGVPSFLVYGTDSDGADLNGELYGDYFHNFNKVAEWNDNDNCRSSSVTFGDFDGDGNQEIVVVGTVITYSGLGSDTGNLNLWVRDDVYTNWQTKIFQEWEPDDICANPSVASADFDRDGKDEILLGLIDGTSFRIMILSITVSGGSWTLTSETNLLYKVNLQGMTGSEASRSQPHVTVGDLDGDGDMEPIAITYDGDGKLRLLIWDYNDDVDEYWGKSHKILDVKSASMKIATGDIDGDYIDEIVIVGTDLDGGDLNGWVYDDLKHGLSEMYHWDRDDNSAKPDVACGDFDNDGIDEVCFYATDFDGGDMNLWIFDDANNNFEELYHSDKDDDYSWGAIVSADINLDGDDEFIIAAQWRGESITRPYHVYTFYLDLINDNVEQKYISWDGTSEKTIYPHIAVADALNTGIKIEYVGEDDPFETRSDPQIMAVVSAPPTIKGITQNYDDSATELGKETSSEETKSESISMSNSLSLSYEADFLGVVEVEASFTLSSETTYGTSVTESYAYCNNYEVSSSNHGVVFANVDFENYKYKVLSHPLNNSLVGTYVSIATPVAHEVLKWELPYFHSKYPEYRLNETLQQEIGDVNSYHTLEEFWNITGGDYWKSKYSSTVGQGEATNSVGIEVAEATTTSEERTYGMEFEAKLTVCGFGVGTSMGRDWNTAYELSIGEGFSYSGTVGDIQDPDEYEDYHYSFGLIVYPYINEDLNLKYQVVDYYVDEAGNLPDIPDDLDNPDGDSDSSNTFIENIVNIAKDYWWIIAIVGVGLIVTIIIFAKKR